MMKNRGTILQYGSNASAVKQNNILFSFSGSFKKDNEVKAFITLFYDFSYVFNPNKIIRHNQSKILTCLTILNSLSCMEIASNECFC